MSTDPSILRAAPTRAEPIGSPSGASSKRVETPTPMKGRRRATRDAAGADGRRQRPSPDGPPDSRKRRPAAQTGPGRRKPARRKRKARKVHRVVRHIEVWSVAKLSMIFVACGYFIALISGYLLWRAADRVGTIAGIEGFMEDSGGYGSFEILGDVVFRSAAAVLAVLAIATVAVVVLGVLLFNLISDLTGGIRMTVIDEDLIVTPARRPPGTAPAGAGPSGRREPGPTDAAPSSPPESRPRPNGVGG